MKRLIVLFVLFAATAVAAQQPLVITPCAMKAWPVGGYFSFTVLPDGRVCVVEAKDQNRTYLVLSYDRIAGATTESLAPLTINSGGTISTGNFYTVPTGKTLRLSALYSEVVNGKNGDRTSVRVRSAASAVGVGSPSIAMVSADAPKGIDAGMGFTDFPDGLEIAAGNQVAISHLESSTDAAIASGQLVGFIY